MVGGELIRARGATRSDRRDAVVQQIVAPAATSRDA
jgi:hypothetical protein